MNTCTTKQLIMSHTSSTVPFHVVVLGRNGCPPCGKMQATLDAMTPSLVKGNGAVTVIDTANWNRGTPTTLLFMPDGSVHTVPGAMSQDQLATILSEKLDAALNGGAPEGVSGGAVPRRRARAPITADDDSASDDDSVTEVVEPLADYPYYAEVTATGKQTPFVKGAVAATSHAMKDLGWTKSECAFLDLSIDGATTVNNPIQANDRWGQAIVINKNHGKALIVNGTFNTADTTIDVVPTSQAFVEVSKLQSTTSTTHTPITRLVANELGIECAL